jgi:hypothetical protein
VCLASCTLTPADAIAKQNKRRPTTPVSVDGTNIVPVRTGGAGRQKVGWTDAGVPTDGRSLLVRFPSNGCSRLDAAEATETDDTVTVTLYVATEPGAEPCVSFGEETGTWVRLARALRGRVVVDGTTKDSPPVAPILR